MAAACETVPGVRVAKPAPGKGVETAVKTLVAALPFGKEMAFSIGRRSTGRTGDFLRGAAMSDTGNNLARDAW